EGCQRGELNSRPRAYESPALPLSYPGVFEGAENTARISRGKCGVGRLSNARAAALSRASMLKIRAFQGLVPDPAQVTDIACVPYDVLNTEDARVLAEGKPNSLLRVDRAELELPADTNPYSDAVYARANDNFLRLQQNGALRRETAQCVYLYRQQ